MTFCRKASLFQRLLHVPIHCVPTHCGFINFCAAQVDEIIEVSIMGAAQRQTYKLIKQFYLKEDSIALTQV
jgi:hypothetical protein